MKYPDLDTVLARFDVVNSRLSDLLTDTRGTEYLERGLARVDWMVSLGVREIYLGRAAKRADIVILGQISGFNNAALTDLANMIVSRHAAGFTHRLDQLRTLLGATTATAEEAQDMTGKAG
jgi:hypothetical protein